MNAARYLPGKRARSNELHTHAVLRRTETQKWNCLRLKLAIFEAGIGYKSGLRGLS
jgi:hypothetical protein